MQGTRLHVQADAKKDVEVDVDAEGVKDGRSCQRAGEAQPHPHAPPARQRQELMCGVGGKVRGMVGEMVHAGPT